MRWHVVWNWLPGLSITSLNIYSAPSFLLLSQAITVAELYGVLDPDTRDWTDGLLSNIFREINKSLPEGRDEAR